MSYSYRDLPFERLSFLVKYGSSLTTVHRKMKNGGKIDDPMNIVEKIKRLKDELKVAKQSVIPPSYSLDERGGDEIIETVQGIVKGMIAAYPDHENEGCYNELLDELDEMKDTLHLNRGSKKQQASYGTIGELSSSSQLLPFDNNDGAFVEAFAELSPEDKGRLLNCVPFAKQCSVDDFIQQNTVISKGVLINWLIGINVIQDPWEGELFLSKLVEEPSFNLMHAYRSRKIIISPEFVRCLASHRQDRTLAINKVDILLVGKDIPPANGSPSTDISELLILVNKSKYRLNDKVIRMTIKSDSRGMLSVVHLGNFHRRGVGDCWVEDTFVSEFDKLLKAQERIGFLSLQGISRVQELPHSVCDLSELRVLDLRSCQDLMYLPNDIGRLIYLVCLDLTQCYQLDHIPMSIALLKNLRVLLGFIVVNDKQQQPKDPNYHFAEFDDLKQLTRLIKLTIRTRRMKFPTNEDLQTLNSMLELRKLKVSWVKSFVVESNTDSKKYDYTEGLPTTLEKLELQAAPETTASILLGLISKRSRNRSLKKLYIRGGNLQKFYSNQHCFPHVKILRLRYLPQLHMDWHEFQLSFPNLSYLQIAECPNLNFFPCDDNGEWIQSDSSL